MDRRIGDKRCTRRMERRRPDACTTLDTCVLGGHQPTNADSQFPNDADHRAGRPPHPATWASLPDTGAWTVARNCPIAQVQYTFYTNGAAVSAVSFLLIHYRKPSPNVDIYDSTWSAPPPSLFRSTSKSQLNNIRGGKNFRPYIRPSVRPQKVSSISMKFGR